MQTGKNVVSMEEHRKKRQARIRVKKQIRYKKTFDYTMIVALAFLVCVGLVMVFSASYYAAEFRESVTSGDVSYYFVKQLICVALGLVVMLAIMFMDYHSFQELPWKKHRWMEPFARIRPYWIILAIAVITLPLVWTPLGRSVNGSSRWIYLFGISIQPAEIVKFALIIFMACAIGRDPRRLKRPVQGVLPYIALLLVICVFLYLQPNFSAIMCIGMLVVVLLYVGGIRLPHLGVIIGCAAIAVVVLIAKEAYRADRLAALADPSQNWQLSQSRYAIASGGLFGRGLGNSMQKLLYLPYSESDFIFSIVVEELGLVGAIVVLAAFVVLIWRCVVAAMRAPDLTGMLIASGVAAMIAIQVVVNVGVVSGLIPPTGVILPFISYGGSAAIVFMGMVGLALNVSRQGRVPLPAKAMAERQEQEDAQQQEPETRRRKRQ